MPRLTKIEMLDTQHPGLRQHVDLRLDGRARHAQIVRELSERFGVTVRQKLISTYKCLRWQPGWAALRRFHKDADQVVKDLGKHGDTNMARTLIVERLTAIRNAGGPIRPETLLTEQRQHAKLRLQVEKLKTEKEKLKWEKDKWRGQSRKVGRALRSARAQAEAAARHGQSITAEDVLKKISHVIGVGAPLEERVEQ